MKLLPNGLARWVCFGNLVSRHITLFTVSSGIGRLWKYSISPTDWMKERIIGGFKMFQNMFSLHQNFRENDQQQPEDHPRSQPVMLQPKQHGLNALVAKPPKKNSWLAKSGWNPKWNMKMKHLDDVYGLYYVNYMDEMIMESYSYMVFWVLKRYYGIEVEEVALLQLWSILHEG